MMQTGMVKQGLNSACHVYDGTDYSIYFLLLICSKFVSIFFILILWSQKPSLITSIAQLLNFDEKNIFDHNFPQTFVFHANKFFDLIFFKSSFIITIG
jgi:hypothetical protein